MTEWALGDLRPLLDDLLGADAVRRRGLFRPEYVAALRDGQADPGDLRRRRVGEKLWTLAALEGWAAPLRRRPGARP